MAAEQSDKPVILLVTGAWHPPPLYSAFKSHIEKLNYECVIPELPTMGTNAIGLTWQADKSKIIETALPYFELGREVVLVGHSYGGMPACAATEGYGVDERRKQGKKGGFRSIIFICAFAIPVKGWDVLTTFGGTWPDWQTVGEAYTKNKFSIPNEKCIELLYSDANERDAKETFSKAVPQSQDAFETGCDFIAADLSIPSTYVVTTEDKLFPVALQEQLVQSVPGMKEVRLAGGHFSFLGKAAETAELVLGVVEGKA